MAYVSVPKDLNKIKTKVALRMTKRQLICFGTAVVIGIPAYIFTRGSIGNTSAVLLMMGIMAPFFLLAMYEKDGLPAEKLVRNFIRTKFYWSEIRYYRTDNFYSLKNLTGNEESTLAKKQNDKKPAKTAKS